LQIACLLSQVPHGVALQQQQQQQQQQQHHHHHDMGRRIV
jgi:hypothetical protein